MLASLPRDSPWFWAFCADNVVAGGVGVGMWLLGRVEWEGSVEIVVKGGKRGEAASVGSVLQTGVGASGLSGSGVGVSWVGKGKDEMNWADIAAAPSSSSSSLTLPSPSSSLPRPEKKRGKTWRVSARDVLVDGGELGEWVEGLDRGVVVKRVVSANKGNNQRYLERLVDECVGLGWVASSEDGDRLVLTEEGSHALEGREWMQEANARMFCKAVLTADAHKGGVSIPLNAVGKAYKSLRGGEWVSKEELNLALADAVQLGLAVSSKRYKYVYITLTSADVASSVSSDGPSHANSQGFAMDQGLDALIKVVTAAGPSSPLSKAQLGQKLKRVLGNTMWEKGLGSRILQAGISAGVVQLNEHDKVVMVVN